MDNFFYYAKNKISEKLNLSSNILLGEPLIELNGMSRIRIENHRGIIQYNANIIKLNTSLGTLQITGENLEMTSLVTEEIFIIGKIESVAYLK